MRFLGLLLALFIAQPAFSAALTNAQTYAAQHPDAFRNGTPGMIMVKGIGSNNSYMLEADPTTGEIPVNATLTLPAILDVHETGGAYADSVRNVYSSTNVTTGAWVQLIASTAAAINCITVFDSSGQTLKLGTGAAGFETIALIVPPGGLGGCIPLHIDAGTRISIEAISATASTGELDLTGIQ